MAVASLPVLRSRPALAMLSAMHSYAPRSLIAAVEACYSETLDLCEQLSDAEWTRQSLCPAWTVRQAVGHAVGVEDAVLGWEINADDMPAFAKMQALTDASAGMSAPDFKARVKQIFDARRAELRDMSDADLSQASWTPVGVQDYAGFLAIRVFDLWVHVRDCAIPLGRPTDDAGLAAEIVMNQVEGSIGYIIGKKVGLPDGMSLRADITGPVQRQIAVVVDGRAKAVEPGSLPDPDVVLRSDSLTFTMLACGRVDPQSKIDEGAISWSGDAHWGEHAARSLRFTM